MSSKYIFYENDRATTLLVRYDVSLAVAWKVCFIVPPIYIAHSASSWTKIVFMQVASVLLLWIRVIWINIRFHFCLVVDIVVEWEYSQVCLTVCFLSPCNEKSTFTFIHIGRDWWVATESSWLDHERQWIRMGRRRTITKQQKNKEKKKQHLHANGLVSIAFVCVCVLCVEYYIQSYMHGNMHEQTNINTMRAGGYAYVFDNTMFRFCADVCALHIYVVGCSRWTLLRHTSTNVNAHSTETQRMFFFYIVVACKNTRGGAGHGPHFMNSMRMETLNTRCSYNVGHGAYIRCRMQCDSPNMHTTNEEKYAG